MVSTHPSADTLAAYGLGRLSGPEGEAVEAHVAGCSECGRRLEPLPPDTLLGLARGAMATPSPADAETPPPVATDALRNHPRYRVLGRIGAGGMGTVYKAEHRLMRREVALKVMAPHLMASPDAVERFRREVRLASRLTHPNVVTVHDADEAGGLHILVMEYVRGVSLDRLVSRKGPLPIHTACQVIRAAAAGLQHAAEHGMVHRDVKPHNLMLTRGGQVKVLDFGLARLAQTAGTASGDPHTLTTPGLMLGTPDFVAPEQARNPAAACTRSDLYALGCTLYFLLTGRPPFTEGNSLAKMVAHLQDTPTPMNELRPEVQPGLVAVVARMMAKRPDDRYQSPAEAADALKPFARGEESATGADAEAVQPPLPVTRRPAPRGVSRRLLLAGGATAGLLAAIGGGMLLLAAHADRPSPSSAAEPSITATTSPRVLLILPPSGLSAAEYSAVCQQLRQAGCRFGVASIVGGVARSETDGVTIPVDRTLDEIRPTDWDAVVLVGGTGVAALLNHNKPQGPAVTRLLHEFSAAGKVVGGVGHAAGVLADAGVLDGRHATGSGYVLQKKPKGVAWEDSPVVTDGRVVTARDELAAEPFVRAVLAGVRPAR